MYWQKLQNETRKFSKDFESFNQAWEFMAFLAKLCRSTNICPLISNKGTQVTIEIDSVDDSNQFYVAVNQYFTDEKTNNVDTHTTLNGISSLYTDGGSRGNPGPSASGFVLYDEQKNEIARGGEFLGVTTNNQAEYHSLRAGVEKALELKVRKLKVYMDSMLVVNQIKGSYKVKNRDLWPIYEALKNDIAKFESFEIVHVPREINKVADSIVNSILDEHIS